MQNHHPNQIFTPSYYYVTKTPEKSVNTSPFRGCSFSDKLSMTPNKQNISYPLFQQTISQNIKHQYPYYEYVPPFLQENKEQLMQRVLNLEEYLKATNKKYDQLKEELEKERNKKYDSDSCYSQLCYRYQEQEKELLKQQSLATSFENMFKSVQRELQEQKEKLKVKNNEIQEQEIIQEKFSKILKQRQKEINDVKLKMKEEKELQAYENDRLVQQFTQKYRDLAQQNDQLFQENNELKTAILGFDDQSLSFSSKKQSEQNVQSNLEFLDDQELRKILQQYLKNDEEDYLNQIPEKQLRNAVSIMKEIFLTAAQKQLKEINSQQFQDPQQMNEQIEINLQEVKKKREQLIKDIKNKMDQILKSKEFNLMEFNEIQRETEELKKELISVENLIQEMEESLRLNPHRNSCVSFDNHDFQ